MPAIMARRRRSAMCLIVLVGFVMTGCGESRSTVLGKITFDGKAVSEGEVTFVPLKTGQPIACLISGDGSYCVENVPPGEAIITVKAPVPTASGASSAGVTIAGRAKGLKETIASETAAGKTPVKTMPDPLGAGKFSSLPEKYANMDTSDLRYVVKPGLNNHDVELKK